MTTSVPEVARYTKIHISYEILRKIMTYSKPLSQKCQVLQLLLYHVYAEINF